MDGIKRHLAEPQKKVTPAPVSRPLPRPSRPSREVLYIPREENLSFSDSGKHEKRFQRRSKLKKTFFWVALITTVLLISLAAFLFWKSFSISRKMNSSILPPTTLAQDMRSLIAPIASMGNSVPLRGEAEGRINILLLGAAGEHKPGGNLTDTVMIMSINVASKKVALLSLPRDLYVQVPNSNNFTKINALYEIGLKDRHGADYIKQAVQQITGLNLDYFAAIDFDGFQQIIDDIGGVNITNERDIFDSRYPGPNYSYQTFSLSKGFHNLDGQTTLKYVRERHDDPQGDFGRAKRQQQVIQAVKNKMFSMQTFFNVASLEKVMETLGDNIKTDITFDEIASFMELSKKVDLQNITNVVVDAWQSDSLLKVSHVTLGNAQAFILVPRVGNYSEIQDLAQNLFNQDEIKHRQNQIAQEDASIILVNESGDIQLGTKIQNLLTDKLGMKNVKLAPAAKQSPVADKTTVQDNTNDQKIYTLDELIKKLPATISTADSNINLPQANSADIVVTLGQDLIDKYKFDEASIDDYNKAQDEQDQNNF